MNTSLIILIALIALILFFTLGIVILIHDIHVRLTLIEKHLDRRESRCLGNCDKD